MRQLIDEGKTIMLNEQIATQNFANTMLASAGAGFHADTDTPAMATPATPTAAQFVVQGSTICLVC